MCVYINYSFLILIHTLKKVIKPKRQYLLENCVDFFVLTMNRSTNRTFYRSESNNSNRRPNNNMAVRISDDNGTIEWSRQQLLDFVNEVIANNSRTSVRPTHNNNIINNNNINNVRANQRQQTGNGPVTSRQQTPRDQTSANPDFTALLRSTFHLVKVQHANNNWANIPKGVDRAVDKLATSIRPPLQNQQLKAGLEAATSDYKSQIVAVVQQHLADSLQQCKQTLRGLNQDDRDLVHDIVRRRVRHTLGRRVTDATIEGALDEASSAGDEAVHPVTTTATNTQQNVTEVAWQTVGGNRKSPTTSTTTSSTTASSSSTSSSVPCTGRFDILRTIDTTEEGDGSQPLFDDGEFPELQRPKTQQRLPSPKASRRRQRSTHDDGTPDANHVTKRADVASTPPGTSAAIKIDIQDETSQPEDVEQTGSASAASPSTSEQLSPIIPIVSTVGVGSDRRRSLPANGAKPRPVGRVFVDKTLAWKALGRSTPGFNTMCLTDSNGRNWNSAPHDYNVRARPGARIEEVTSILMSTQIPTTTKVVVIAVGVNNRLEEPSTILARLTSLNRAFDRHQCHFLFAEVVHHPNMNNKELQGVNYINKAALETFGADRVIRLPADLIVEAETDNPRDTVHYSVKTAQQVVINICSAVMRLN